jgi:hypothetical protein
MYSNTNPTLESYNELVRLVGDLDFTRDRADLRSGEYWRVYAHPWPADDEKFFDVLISLMPRLEEAGSAKGHRLTVYQGNVEFAPSGMKNTNERGQIWFRHIPINIGSLRGQMMVRPVPSAQRAVRTRGALQGQRLRGAALAADAAERKHAEPEVRPPKLIYLSDRRVLALLEEGLSGEAVVTTQSREPEMAWSIAAFTFGLELHDAILEPAESAEGAYVDRCVLDAPFRAVESVSREFELVRSAASSIACRVIQGGRIVLCLSRHDGIELRGAESGQALWTRNLGRLVSYLTAFSRDNSRLAAADRDGKIALLDVETGSSLASIPVSSGPLLALALSPDGTTLASADHDGSIRLIESASGKQLWEVPGYGSTALSLAFSPDGRFIAAGGRDGKVRTLEAGTGKAAAECGGHEGAVLTLAFSADGRLLASGGTDRVIRVWDATAGQLGPQLAGHEGSVLSLAFSPDSELLLSGSADGSAIAWETRTGNLLSRFEKHAAVESVCFAPKGPLAVTAGADGRVMTWDPRTAALRPVPFAPMPEGEQ